jgi:hypothetical protein
VFSKSWVKSSLHRELILSLQHILLFKAANRVCNNYWFLIWPSYFNLSEIIRKRTVFSANKFTEVKHRVHNYWIWIKFYVYGGFGGITKEVWAKAEDHVLKIEKEYGKENCIGRSEIPPIIIDFDDDESSDEESWIQSNMITDWRVHQL